MNELWGVPAGIAAFDPLSLGWHTAAWLDDPAWTNPGNGNAISSLRDGSGNSHTLTQATGAQQPLFRSSETLLNNHACAEFDGSNDFLASASFTAVNQTYSVVWIGVRVGTGGATAPRLVDLANGGGSFACVYMRTSTSKWGMYGGSAFLDSTASYDTTAGHALRAKFAGASSEVNVGGTSTTGSAGTGTATYFELGGYPGAGASDYAACKTGFAGLYAGDVTAAGSWGTFVSWVSTYYGLTIA